ncbi:MAG: DUF3887 domain-containing protein, partial [Bryobacterales bacterium]|nr:DUF3887 domain-containing protein [Bryobacterales bacterium]
MSLKLHSPHLGVPVIVLLVVSAAAQINPGAIGRKALDDLLAQRFSELRELFDTAMKENLTPDVLRGRVSSELATFGKPETIGEPVVGHEGQLTVVTLPVTFSKTKVNVQFHIHESGELAAIHFRPADSAPPVAWQRPAYSNPNAFQERAI